MRRLDIPVDSKHGDSPGFYVVLADCTAHMIMSSICLSISLSVRDTMHWGKTNQSNRGFIKHHLNKFLESLHMCRLAQYSRLSQVIVLRSWGLMWTVLIWTIHPTAKVSEQVNRKCCLRTWFSNFQSPAPTYLLKLPSPHPQNFKV